MSRRSWSRRGDEGSIEVGGKLRAVERPLRILADGRRIAVLMRTPGDDDALVRGFLLTEGAVASNDEIEKLELDGDEARCALSGAALGVPSGLRLSSCGLCVADAEKALSMPLPEVKEVEPPERDVLASLPDLMKEKQELYRLTGCTHAAALFDSEGRMLSFGEDIGRHNALDKAVGQALASGGLDRGCVILTSGRISFEMAAKSARAGVPILAALGAATSLGTSAARRARLKLVTFLRGESYELLRP